jgi:outer membrane protein assembly factor BamE
MMPPQYWKWKFYPMRILLISLAIACLSACGFPGVYKINVEQGNIVTQEMVDQLKPGMNRRQVRFVLGTPLIEDTFDQNRWDYLYVKRNGAKVLDRSLLTVEFDGDTLIHISGDLVPTDWGAGNNPAPAHAPQTEPAPGIPTGG